MAQIHEFLLDFQMFKKNKKPFGNYRTQGVEVFFLCETLCNKKL